MPAGVPMTSYLKVLAASLLAMFAGAEVVHRYYRPDLTNNAAVALSYLFRLLLRVLTATSRTLNGDRKCCFLGQVHGGESANTAGMNSQIWQVLLEFTIPDIPPKPGELKTELLGLKEREHIKHEPQISQQ